jgi:hypothetical protein
MEGWLVRYLWLGRAAALAYVEISNPKIRVADPTERLVSKIHDLAGAHGARLLVALQSRDDRLASHLKTEHISFVALDGATAFSSQHGSHFTPEGHAFAARQLFDLLNEPGRAQNPNATN